MPKPVHQFLQDADVIFGIGCSFTETNFGVSMPKGKTIIHATLDPDHLNKDVRCAVGLVGDAGLTLDAMLAEAGRTVTSPRDSAPVGKRIAAMREEWLAQWLQVGREPGGERVCQYV